MTRAVVLDANVMMRAVLGRKVDRLLERFAAEVSFAAPDVAFADVGEHLPAVLSKRGDISALQLCLDKLTSLEAVIRPIEQREYSVMKAAALARIGNRDPDDWPVLACALRLDYPVWTEDQDFFGTGVATWTTALIEIYLSERESGLSDA